VERALLGAFISWNFRSYFAILFVTLRLYLFTAKMQGIFTYA